MSDPVNQPAHYTAGDIECIKAIRAALGPKGFVDYCRGCIIRYNWRMGLKGPALEDMQKSARYAAYAAECLGEAPPSQLFNMRAPLRDGVEKLKAELERTRPYDPVRDRAEDPSP